LFIYIYKPKANHNRESSSNPKWILPPEGKVLVNVDATIFTDLLRKWVLVLPFMNTMVFALLLAGEPSNKATMP
jgi:hypothetical protein